MPRNRNSLPSCLFDLSEHRLDHLLSEPVAASRPRAFQRAAALSFGLGGVLGATSCDVSADPAIGQGVEVGLAAVPGIGGSFLGLPAADPSLLG
jgi:hypothetical protein